MNTDVDVMIIGGGPAGLAAGITCASHGLHTMVCEKRLLPVDKACGEGVMPTGLSYLERLGVKKYLANGQQFPFDGIRYVSPQGKIASAAFQEGPGWGIPRLDLSAALLQRASELDRLEIRTGVRSTPIRIDRKGKHGSVWTQVGKDHVKARLLIGADGLNSGVRRWAGLQASKGTYQRWGARQHFQVAPWGREVEVHWGAGMEAYVTPCGEHLVGVAFLWDRQRHPYLPGGDRLIPNLLQAFPVLARQLKDAPASDAPLAVGPMQQRVTRPTAEGVLLIGDAAGYLDALTGEGISLTLAQALALEKTVVPMLLSPTSDGQSSRHTMIAYEQAYQAIMRPYYLLTHLVLWLSRHPTLAEQTIGLLGQRPRLFQFLLSANMGLFPPGTRKHSTVEHSF